MATSTASPVWSVQNEGSFASIRVDLPAGAEVCCESDAVVSFSETVDVKGTLSGGLLGSLARSLFTNESFFTTRVFNTSNDQPADVLFAPSEPGGIVLHQLDRHGLFMTSGVYVASDRTVVITSQVQSRMGNSLFSGTGLFLLHARGTGMVACGAYGAIHKYQLQVGQVRAVDNGHLVAWTGQMRYTTGLASGGTGVLDSIMGSYTSGEGLVCFFEGPGTLYIQSHKPSMAPEDGKRRPTQGSNPASACIACTLFILFGLMILFAVVSPWFVEFAGNSRQSYNTQYPRQRYRQQVGGNAEF